MRTKEEYLESISAMRPNIYMGGEMVGRSGIPGFEMMCVTFDAAHDPEIQRVTNATSHLTGENINRF